EFVVERGGAERAVGHDFQRRRHARVERAFALPRLRQRRDAQVGDAETGEPGLGLAAAAGGALVADLAAGAGGRTRERRDLGRMVVGLYLDAEGAVGQALGAVFVRLRVRPPAARRVTRDYRGVVAVRRQRVRRRGDVGLLDHPEQ